MGFQLLLDLVTSKNNNYFIFTSNVDGQFQKAGFDEEKIYEVHGSIHHLQCSKNCSYDIWSAKDTNVPIDEEEFLAMNIPQCPKCNQIARPNILMFGDWDWNTKQIDKQEARYNKWLKNNRTKRITIIEIGAGRTIPTVRYQGEKLSKRNPLATLIRINPREYNLDGASGYSVPLGGAEGIKLITSLVQFNFYQGTK